MIPGGYLTATDFFFRTLGCNGSVKALVLLYLDTTTECHDTRLRWNGSSSMHTICCMLLSCGEES